MLQAEILQTLDHENIVGLVGVYENCDYYQLVLHRCPGTSLFALVDLNTRIPEHPARVIFKQVTSIMQALW